MARIVKEEEYTGRRNEILDVARRLVYTKGYEEMTIQDILDALRISKGAFYHYFDSKQDLLNALIDRMIEEGIQVVDPIAADASLPALEKLHRYFATAAIWKTAQKDYLLALLRIWYDDKNAIVRQKMITAAIKQIGPVFNTIVCQGVAEGVFHPSFPDQVGEVFLSMWLGFADRVVEFFLVPDSHGDALQRLQNIMAAYSDALERILGAPKGSMNLVDDDILRQWLPPPGESTSPNGKEG